ncbi:MAG TPA: type VI secretion protein IcmF/TssM N-terminal domain-containing protein, partial [Bryobacteraceae bacterium]|nr:type VI secretion protein IcmF/TssM N-terminal domain-containing protein [Bryobacteraceae bacterium]
MNKSKIAAITVGIVALGAGLSWLSANVHSIPGLKNVGTPVLDGIIVVLGLIAAAVTGWLVSGKFRAETAPAKSAGEGEELAEITDLDDLLAEAEARLHDAQLEKGAGLAKLPAVLVLGETGSAKTSTVTKCGLNPELLAGQIYEENRILPTPTANFWFTQRAIFVEMAGKLLGDSESWTRVMGRLRPGKAAELLGSAREEPRAALVCVDAETLLSPSPDPLAASARKIRTQLGEISEKLGIDLPVYVLFTRTDRIPFFTEYFSKLNDKEATRILGTTLPVMANRRGVYAEEETARLNGGFEGVFRGLANARLEYLPRETSGEQLSAIYEFPREFRKIRAALVRFLVEMGRPSQLNAGPFLRGFYFSGVRPIVVNEVAPAAPQANPAAAGQLGATVIFGARGGQAPAPQRVVGTRKVPQWLFLGHFFSDLLLADPVAKSAAGGSARASMPRCVLLGAAAALCLFYSIALAISYGNNRALANRVISASQGIAAADTSAGVASLDSLQRLESLRQTLATLGDYKLNGAPWGDRWGLYAGNDYYPDARQLYFVHFRRLLLAPTQATIVESLAGLPPAPGPGYGPTYDSLKAYLITTSNPDKSTRAFLAPVLLDRWSASRNVDADRLALARKQFEFYSDELRAGNPFSSANDSEAVEKARRYLAQFAAVERVYQAMLADASKTGPAINFNRRFPGSAEVVVDNQEVAAPFAKPGWAFMRAALKNPEKYF